MRRWAGALAALLDRLIGDEPMEAVDEDLLPERVRSRVCASGKCHDTGNVATLREAGHPRTRRIRRRRTRNGLAAKPDADAAASSYGWGDFEQRRNHGGARGNQRIRTDGPSGVSGRDRVRRRHRVGRDQRRHRPSDARPAAQVRLGLRPVRRDRRGRRRRDRRERRARGDADASRPGACSRGRSWTSTSSSSPPDVFRDPRGRREAPRGGREEGHRLRAGQGAGRDGRARRELRRRTTPSATTSSRTLRARRTASRRWPRCSTRRSAFDTA